MKILYIDPAVRTPTSAKYKYYDGIFNQLVKFNEVFLQRGLITDLDDFIKKTDFKPDAIIFGLGWFEKIRYYGKIENINVPTVCYVFKPQNNLEQKLQFCKVNNINLIVTPIPTYKEYEKITGVETVLFPFGFDEENFYPRFDAEKKFDIGFSGALHQSMHYPADSFQIKNLRPRIGDMLKGLSGVDVFWKSSDNAATAFIDSYEEYAKTINSSKIWLATLAAFGDVTPRFYEVLGTGTMLMCQKIPETYKFLLKNEINCVEFNDDLTDFEEKIHFYIANPEKLKEITDNAIDFFHNNWTWRHRAEEMTKLISEI